MYARNAAFGGLAESTSANRARRGGVAVCAAHGELHRGASSNTRAPVVMLSLGMESPWVATRVVNRRRFVRRVRAYVRRSFATADRRHPTGQRRPDPNGERPVDRVALQRSPLSAPGCGQTAPFPLPD